MIPDDLIKRVRDEARRPRKLTQIERARQELAPFVDTGSLTDDEVRTLHALYRDAKKDANQD